MSFIISKTTSSGETQYMRKPRESQGPVRRESQSPDPRRRSQDSSGDGKDENASSESDEITAAIERIKKMDAGTLASLARAFLKPAESTG